MQQQKPENFVNLSLHDKIEASKEVIIEALERFSRDELYVAWTGGKDSTTMVWLFRQACKALNKPMPRSIFIHEGDIFKEIFELINQIKMQWKITVKVIKNSDISDKARFIGDMIRVEDLNERNRQELKRLGLIESSFPFEPESYICNHLMKTVALNIFLEKNGVKALATGIRWDEQEARSEEDYFSIKADPEHTRVHPILHFKERDIWNAIHKYNVPFCSLYREGYRSLGAKCSTIKTSDIAAWKQDLENTPERNGRSQDKEEIMARLRDLGYM
jgi:phosphoadenosine phosphosulfate reductase